MALPDDLRLFLFYLLLVSGHGKKTMYHQLPYLPTHDIPKYVCLCVCVCVYQRLFEFRRRTLARVHLWLVRAWFLCNHQGYPPVHLLHPRGVQKRPEEAPPAGLWALGESTGDGVKIGDIAPVRGVQEDRQRFVGLLGGRGGRS